MNKNTAQKILKIFGIFNYICGALIAILGVVMLVANIPELNTEIKKIVDIDWQGIEPNVVFGIIFITSAIITLFEGWALRRAGKDSQKTTLALVLTILTLIGAIARLFNAESIVSQIGTVAVNALLVYSVVVVRKDQQGAK